MRFKLQGNIFWPETFALKLMWTRGGQQIGLPDLLGGLYLGSHEKFLLYCQRWDDLAALMVDHCGVRDPVWFYWCEMYETFKKPSSNPFLDVFAIYDDQAVKILNRASEIGHQTDSQGIKIIGVELFLLAIFDFEQIDLCCQLLNCGIEREKLKSATG